MRVWPQRILVLGPVLVLACATIVAFGVIPAVRADTFPFATQAVPAFWANALLNVLVAASAPASARVGLTRATRGAYFAGSVALLLGLALADAAASEPAHGSSIRGVVVALCVCVCFELAGGVSMIASAFVARR